MNMSLQQLMPLYPHVRFFKVPCSELDGGSAVTAHLRVFTSRELHHREAPLPGDDFTDLSVAQLLCELGILMVPVNMLEFGGERVLSEHECALTEEEIASEDAIDEYYSDLQDANPYDDYDSSVSHT